MSCVNLGQFTPLIFCRNLFHINILSEQAKFIPVTPFQQIFLFLVFVHLGYHTLFNPLIVNVIFSFRVCKPFDTLPFLVTSPNSFLISAHLPSFNINLTRAIRDHIPLPRRMWYRGVCWNPAGFVGFRWPPSEMNPPQTQRNFFWSNSCREGLNLVRWTV